MNEPNIAHVAGLMGDPARARMLLALMGGKALTASELALEAGITAQTASSHLAKLVENRLLVVRRQGRHKYFQLHGADVAELIESLLAVASKKEMAPVFTGPRNPALRKARVCYDHLAGELAVRLYQSLLDRGHLEEGEGLALTDSGMAYFDALGAQLADLKGRRRPLCKSCLDWSERRYHLAGALGKWVLDDLLTKKWAGKDLDSRVVRFTPAGFNRFCKRYGLSSAG